jgi:hypothetical protein
VSTPAFRFWSDEDLEKLPPLEWRIDRLLQCGAFGVLYGTSGVGKSFVALSLAVAVALDRAWLGREVRGGRVVYLAAEAAYGLPKRVAALKRLHGVRRIERLTIVPEVVYLHHAQTVLAYLSQLSSQVKGPIALTIVDTLSRCSAGSDEASNADRELTVEGVNLIRQATKGAVLAVHHTGWKEQDRMRGGYALQAAVDTVLALRNGDGGLELKVEKMREDEDGEVIPLALRRLGDSCVIDEASPGSKTLTEQQRNILRSLYQSATSEGLSTSEWQKCTSAAASSFYAARKRLLEDELITAVHGSRRFTVSPEGLQLLQLQSNSKALQNGAGLTPLQHPLSRGGGVGVPELEESEENREERLAIQAEGAA